MTGIESPGYHDNPTVTATAKQALCFQVEEQYFYMPEAVMAIKFGHELAQA